MRRTRRACMSAPVVVGIVLVSHSAVVAESVADLARGLAAGGPVVPVAAAGGTADGGLGTSAERVLAAAREVDRERGSRCWRTWAARC